MKKSVLKELSRKLLGSVTDNPDVLDYFSTDSSIFRITPEAVVYPQNTADVRKLAQHAWEQTVAGKPVSLVPRGLGSDLGGSALGEGIQVVFPAHMNKLLRLDRDTVAVQPGISFRTLQQTLHTHGRFVPVYPDNLDTTTVGGAVAGDMSGEKSVQYGSIRNQVKGLKVVLADGSLIQTHRISARELNRKKGLSTLEGEIYRKFDSLLLDHAELIKKHWPRTPQNSAGYALDKIRAKDGSFDLTQVFIGAQGTLGFITEVTLRTFAYNPRTTLVTASLQAYEALGDIVAKLTALGPSALDLVDHTLLDHLQANHPGALEGVLPDPVPKLMLLVEFQDGSQFQQKLKSNRAMRLLSRHGAQVRVSKDPVEQVALWKLRRTSANVHWTSGSKKAVPFIDDCIIPVERFTQFFDKTHKLMMKHDLEVAIWGHAGTGNLRVLPFLDISKKKDVDKLFSLAREFYQMVAALGGSTSGGGGDGLIRALSLSQLYGEDMAEVLASTKHIFDPHNLCNPMKKTQVTEEFLRAHLRNDYGRKHLDHLPTA